MGLFSKQKKELIPEPQAATHASRAPSFRQSNTGAASIAPSTVSAAPSYRTHQGYVPPSQGGQGYDRSANHYSRPDYQQGQGSYGAPPPQQQPPQPAPVQKDRWGRVKKTDDNARNELLGGAPGGGGQQSYRGTSAYDQPMPEPDGPAWNGHQEGGAEQELDEDEEVEGIKQQMRFVKQESLASTRNAVRIAREAEETARATLDKLGDQSG